jgi:Metallopeptidase family M24
MGELERKLDMVRWWMTRERLAGIRLRGADWFAWATCGGSNVVLLTTDTGVAEVLITERNAAILTDEIEAGRLRHEEVPAGFDFVACRWSDRPAALDGAVRERTGGGKVASDRPVPGEMHLPEGLVSARWSLSPEELERYRALGREAAEAMTQVLRSADPAWTEWHLAGAGAEALWGRGIEPALTLVGGERRLPAYRHATATKEKLGSRAMLVFCARRHGLFANLTRFVYFRAPSPEEIGRDAAVADVEADLLDAARPGASLGHLYEVIANAYARVGYRGAERGHHQGGPCGYLSRDAIAVPGSELRLAKDGAAAFNPSLPGAKMEDTVVVGAGGVEVLTADAAWPVRAVRGRRRPDLLVR